MRSLRGWRILLALVFAASLVGAQKAPPPTLTRGEPSPHAARGVTFRDVAGRAGIGGFRHVSGSPAKDYIIEATGSGCALVDYDNDGWLDAYLVNASTFEALRGAARPPRAALYRNKGDGSFTDVTARAGVANERWGQGVAAGDFDNDGWTDLYVTNFGRNRLYRNNRDGTFTDVAAAAGVDLDSWSTGCAFGDYDGDGRLDLFVAGYVRFDLARLPPPAHAPAATAQKAGREDPTAPIGLGASYDATAGECRYRGRRVMCGPRGLPGAPDHLYRNNGDGTFTDVSARAGVADAEGLYGFGVGWFDFDDDGKLDLVVANDSMPNYLYRNRGDGTFEDVSYGSGVALDENGRAQAHMGVALGDYDNDGRTDVHITNFADDSNVLYHNDGSGTFTDVTFASGIGEASHPFLGWGTHFLDYDNDGWLDLMVANGHVYPEVDAADWNTSYRQRALLFRNLRGRFVELGAAAGEGITTPRSVRGSAAGDFDNDGDVDVLLNAVDGPPALLRNEGGDRAGRWIELRLSGDVARGSPRDAIGAVVLCTAGGIRRRAEVASGRSHCSQSDLRVHFGLGSATSVERLEVRWPNGTSVVYPVPAVDAFYRIDQGGGVARLELRGRR